MAISRYSKKKPFKSKSSSFLTIAQQKLFLKKHYPNSETKTICGHSLIWEGILQPTPLSEEYRIRVKYRIKRKPLIFVKEPELRRYGDEEIPHVFSKGDLCLFRYKYDEWDFSKSIAEYIIPWTSLWLYYYEIWLATGEWLGKGEHPYDETQKLGDA